MLFRTGLVTSVLITGMLATGCSSTANRGTTPTSPSSVDDGGSATRPPQAPGPNPPPASGTCNAAHAQWAIGQPASDTLLERARVDATAGLARFIRPNQPITLEYSGARLNLYLDAQDVVQSAVCG